jgi:hypothetical protein
VEKHIGKEKFPHPFLVGTLYTEWKTIEQTAYELNILNEWERLLIDCQNATKEALRRSIQGI